MYLFGHRNDEGICADDNLLHCVALCFPIRMIRHHSPGNKLKYMINMMEVHIIKEYCFLKCIFIIIDNL